MEGLKWFHSGTINLLTFDMLNFFVSRWAQLSVWSYLQEALILLWHELHDMRVTVTQLDITQSFSPKS